MDPGLVRAGVMSKTSADEARIHAVLPAFRLFCKSNGT
jgi:hypothetical protein